MDRNGIALSLLPQLIARATAEIDSHASRRELVHQAFAWADTFVEVRSERSSMSRDHMLSDQNLS